MPGRHDPEIGCDVHRGKLRLGQPHPVLLGHLGHTQHLAAHKKVLHHQQLLRFAGRHLGGEQGDHTAALPAILGRRHARLAKQRLFGVGLRIGVFHRHGKRIQRVQRIADRFNPVLGAHQTQLKHRRLSKKVKCWHPLPGASM